MIFGNRRTIISGYQQFLSPHKGFCCAHRAVHGGVSCSQAVKQLILTRGIVRAWPFVKARFDGCRNAYVLLMTNKRNKKETKDSDTDKMLQCLNIGTAPCVCIPW